MCNQLVYHNSSRSQTFSGMHNIKSLLPLTFQVQFAVIILLCEFFRCPPYFIQMSPGQF
jgi:hypothetical protein